MKAKTPNTLIMTSTGFLLFAAILSSILNTSKAFPAASEDSENTDNRTCERKCWKVHDECSRSNGDDVILFTKCVTEKDKCVERCWGPKCPEKGKEEKCNSAGTSR